MKVGVLCIKKEGVHFDTPPSGMDLKREGANISLAIKFLGRGGAGSPSVLT